jgi:hypothetical protein
MSRSHVQRAPSYVRFGNFGVADNGRTFYALICCAIAQTTATLSEALSDILFALNRLMSGRFEVFAQTKGSPRLALKRSVACFQLQTVFFCSVDGDVGEHLTDLAIFILESDIWLHVAKCAMRR